MAYSSVPPDASALPNTGSSAAKPALFEKKAGFVSRSASFVGPTLGPALVIPSLHRNEGDRENTAYPIELLLEKACELV
jgi:hypothetical protein